MRELFVVIGLFSITEKHGCAERLEENENLRREFCLFPFNF